MRSVFELYLGDMFNTSMRNCKKGIKISLFELHTRFYTIFGNYTLPFLLPIYKSLLTSGGTVWCRQNRSKLLF